ncbi:acyl-CoA synthetase (AMP-forming)/AMP-acid ligase II [Rhodococcus fascians]|uniref:AMP-binding protein n=1 Tax=Nocardiaceae TaxID=85025 RepID=UPI00285C89CA|nr:MULTISPECIES: AMP-binding protein [Rhodococcus]MDR6910759.1 acyl-CoA synthetase (AMP-forming)/AMP-acid ligase II [Rhodococcus sp. 3258]MDR6931874.1 acyl-CoA synthetase (AMP-forming)/AMP-acid ligase II [Rhodococcus fascians]
MHTNTIPYLLTESARLFGDNLAVVDGDRRLDYSELDETTRLAGAGFIGIGVEAGDRVAIWAPNKVDFIVALLGAQRIGASVVPLNSRYRGYEAHSILARSRATALVVANGFLDTDYVTMLQDAGEGAGTIVPGLPHLRAIVDMMGSGHPDTVPWSEFTNAADAYLTEADNLAAAVDGSTVSDILFTSGTTGSPKGVVTTQAQTLRIGRTWARGAGLSPRDRYAIVSPFFHGFGYKAGIMAALTSGSTIYPVLTFDPVAVMALIETEKITVMPGAPTIFLTLIDHPKRTEFDLSSLRYATAGATSVPGDLFEKMRDVLGFDTAAQAYGLTECMVATQSHPDDDPRHIAETTGRPVEGIEIRVVDSTSNDVDTGVDGEVWLRGETVMVGYFEDPEATAAAIDSDGWLHTGDIGRLDEHGCLKITDRMKDMFIVGGFNVYPAEVENAISAHPDVSEAAVIGIADERLGTVAYAYVVPRHGTTVFENDLEQWCRVRLANFKVPRHFVVVESLPRNASGKVLKRTLRQKV